MSIVEERAMDAKQIISGALFLSALVLAGASPTAEAAEPIPFAMGEASPANTYLAVWMAEEAGLYEAQGLEFRTVIMDGGREMASDLAAGNIQLMHIGMSSVIRANLMGSDLVEIGSLSNIIRQTMFVAPGIRRAEDLRGRAIGISSAGSESDSTTMLALARLGLTRDDVRIREIGRDRLDAVRRGMVSATMLGEPSRSQALALELNPIVDLYADRIPWLYSGLVVERSYLNEHRDAVLGFMRATIEGNYLAVTNEIAAKNVLSRRLNLTDADIVDAGYDNFKLETPINAEIDPAGAENVVKTLADTGASDDINDYVDLSVVEELRAEGFIAAMEEKYGVH